MAPEAPAASDTGSRFNVEEIKRRLTCAQVALRYGVTLKAHGRKSTGLCPFHAERTPSFGIDRDRELWHCFGCGAGGDVLELIRRPEGLGGRRADFGDALAVAAELAGYLSDGRPARRWRSPRPTCLRRALCVRVSRGVQPAMSWRRGADQQTSAGPVARCSI